MAVDTPASYRNLVLYEVYVRNHGPHGTLADVAADLPRIRALGVDVLWFMPIHPIGRVKRKGRRGSPYAIADYREVNPEYGTRADFVHLLEQAHALGLRVMIDVVYNHTAHDSLLVREHPEWFHQDEQGRPISTVPEWSDVIDLRHPNPALTDYLCQTLQGWAALGVDGFRCDVAALLPQDFWLEARRRVAQVKPGVLWLAESVHAAFVAFRRAHGLPTLSDGELYAAFDLTYDYDIWPIWQAAVRGRVALARYLEMLRFQDCVYPENYVKMRCVENHDQARIMRLAPGRNQALAWTAFQAFNRGAFLIYAGQESAAVHTPSLFEVDPIAWGDYELSPLLSALAGLKKDPAVVGGQLLLLAAEPVLQAAWVHPDAGLYGLFNVAAASGELAVPLSDGTYPELLGGGEVRVRRGRVSIPATAAILRCAEMGSLQPLHCDLLDYHFPAG